jgi:alpha-glucosidase
VLSNHDVRRHVSRYGGGETGERRARAAALLQLALPGAVYLYNGDELGLPNVDDLPESVLQDPVWERSGHTRRGRDGCRVPMPWSGDRPPFGFSSASSTWLPMPSAWRSLTVEAQDADPASMLSLYRAALRLRETSQAFEGESLQWLHGPADCLVFRRPGGLVCLVNLSEAPVPLPEGHVLLASAAVSDGTVPVDAAVWLVG